MGSDSQIDPPAPALENRAHGFTCSAHHEIAGLLSFPVLLAKSKTVCAIFEEEAPTPAPSTTTPDFCGVWYYWVVSKRRVFAMESYKSLAATLVIEC